MKITVLSPHRDDAAFSVGLAIASWLSAGHAVQVVNCFTRSRYSSFGDLEFVHANDLQSYVTALRHREDLRWSRKYPKPIPLRDLNLRDAPQRLRCTVDEVCSIPPRPDDASAAKIRSSLESFPMDALVLPLAIGAHVDHLTARIAVQTAWPGTPLAFYEDLPYSARPGLAETIPAQAESLALHLQPGFAVQPTNVEEAVSKKRGLALCYDSQIDNEVVAQISEFCRRYEGRERLWTNSAWRTSPLGATP